MNPTEPNSSTPLFGNSALIELVERIHGGPPGLYPVIGGVETGKSTVAALLTQGFLACDLKLYLLSPFGLEWPFMVLVKETPNFRVGRVRYFSETKTQLLRNPATDIFVLDSGAGMALTDPSETFDELVSYAANHVLESSDDEQIGRLLGASNKRLEQIQWLRQLMIRRRQKCLIILNSDLGHIPKRKNFPSERGRFPEVSFFAPSLVGVLYCRERKHSREIAFINQDRFAGQFIGKFQLTPKWRVLEGPYGTFKAQVNPHSVNHNGYVQ